MCWTHLTNFSNFWALGRTLLCLVRLGEFWPPKGSDGKGVPILYGDCGPVQEHCVPSSEHPWARQIPRGPRIKAGGGGDSWWDIRSAQTTHQNPCSHTNSHSPKLLGSQPLKLDTKYIPISFESSITEVCEFHYLPKQGLKGWLVGQVPPPFFQAQLQPGLGSPEKQAHPIPELSPHLCAHGISHYSLIFYGERG